MTIPRVVAALALAGLCSAQNETAAAEADALVATVHVANTTRYEPGTWSFTITAPATAVDTVLDRYPHLNVQRETQSGEWRPVEEVPGSRFLHSGDSSGTLRSTATSVSPRVFPGIRLQPGTFQWRGEMCDWRVMAFGGNYRAKVVWYVRDDRTPRITEWATFRVTDDGTSFEALRAAQQSDAQLWHDYKTFTSSRLDFDALTHLLWSPMLPQGAGAALNALLWNSPHSPRNRVEQIAPPDGALARRVALVRAYQDLFIAMGTPAGQDRDTKLAAATATCNGLGLANGDYYGAIATLLAIAGERAAKSDKVDALVTAAKANPALVEIAKTSDGLWRVLEPPPPPRADPSGGPPGPSTPGPR